jgi:hypothetical protein
VSVSSSIPTDQEDVLSNQAKWSVALRLLGEALKLLDESDGPLEVGAQLDLTIHRLEGAIHQSVQRHR